LELPVAQQQPVGRLHRDREGACCPDFASAANSWDFCCFLEQPSDFPTAAYEADWLAEPNQTYSTLNQQNYKM
jgi:hypothetical protein